MKVKTRYMVLFDLVIILIGSITILLTGNTNEKGLWVGVVILGLGMSSCWPAILSFVEERINVTSAVAAIFAFFSTSHAVAGPLIEGRVIDSFPMIFAYVNLVSICIALCLYVVLNVTDIWRKRYITTQ